MSSAYDTAVLADSPLAYWPLDDTGTTAADATGNGHTLTLASGVTTGTPSLLPGDTETAMTWTNAVTSESTVASPGAFAVATPCIEFWVSITTMAAAGNNVHIVRAGEFPGGGFGAGYQGGTGWLLTTYAHADNTFSILPTTDTVYYTVISLDGSGNAKLYINSVLSQTLAGVGITAFSDTATIGGQASDSEKLKGVLQKVAVYSTPLSQARITAHWQAAQASTGGGGLLLRFVNT